MENSPILELYRSAFTKLDDPIYLLDKEGFLIDCNPKLLRFLGFESIKDNSIGAIYEMMRNQGLWTTEQIQTFQRNDIDAILSGEKNIEQQALINSNGSILYFEIARLPLSDSAGNALGLVVILRDQTKEKQLHEQLKNLKSRLRYSNNLSSERHSEAHESKLKILLIEDNPIAQKAEKMILMSCRCLTDVVATPTQAHEVFKPGKYDLVLMDLTLEEGDGYHLTATLRKREQGSNYRVPIIALTGHDPTVVGFNCEDAEMDGIMRKPLTVEQANQLIQRYIRHVDVSVKGLKEFKH
jgi:PAS domain S-box-containing protein